MENEFIPYEQALALKELGFNEICFFVYNNKNKLVQKSPTVPLIYVINIDGGHGAQCTAPLYQQAFRWFRDSYELLSIIQYNRVPNRFWFRIEDAVFNDVEFKTYEEAEFECLKKLVEIVKSR